MTWLQAWGGREKDFHKIQGINLAEFKMLGCMRELGMTPRNVANEWAARPWTKKGNSVQGRRHSNFLWVGNEASFRRPSTIPFLGQKSSLPLSSTPCFIPFSYRIIYICSIYKYFQVCLYFNHGGKALGPAGLCTLLIWEPYTQKAFSQTAFLKREFHQILETARWNLSTMTQTCEWVAYRKHPKYLAQRHLFSAPFVLILSYF